MMKQKINIVKKLASYLILSLMQNKSAKMINKKIRIENRTKNRDKIKKRNLVNKQWKLLTNYSILFTTKNLF